VLDPAAHLIQERPRARDVGRLAAGEAEQLSFLRRPDRAADRALDQRGAFRCYLFREPPFGFRAHRAHLDEQLPFTSPARSCL